MTIKGSAFVPTTDQVRGFVLDVATGRLDEVEWSPARTTVVK